jgi:hypothetical protein
MKKAVVGLKKATVKASHVSRGSGDAKQRVRAKARKAGLIAASILTAGFLMLGGGVTSSVSAQPVRGVCDGFGGGQHNRSLLRV